MEGSLPGALLALAYFGVFQLCGLCLARLALPRESAGVRLLLGSVWGSLCLQWFPVLFAFPLGFAPAAHLGALALALLCAGAALWKGRGRPGVRQALSAFGRRKFLWVVLGVWEFFCFLVWHSFRWEGGAVYSSQATYGDMSMHLSFLTSLANQGDFPPDYSLLPGARLSYPFLSDSISASLYLLGAPLWLAYQLPMWVAGAQVLFGIYAFFARMAPEKGRAALAWMFFVCNGGFGFLYFLGGGWENFTRIFTAFYETPTNLIGENIRWVNVLVDMMLPQRATLFGWAVLFPALYLLHRAVFGREPRCFLLVGLMAGAMPMVHTHSFLALGVICGGWLLTFCAAFPGRNGPPGWASSSCWQGLGPCPWGKSSSVGGRIPPCFCGRPAGCCSSFWQRWAFSPGRCSGGSGHGGPFSPGARCWRRPWCRPCPSCSTGPSSRRGRGASSRGTWAGSLGRTATCPST